MNSLTESALAVGILLAAVAAAWMAVLVLAFVCGGRLDKDYDGEIVYDTEPQPIIPDAAQLDEHGFEQAWRSIVDQFAPDTAA